MGVPNANQCTNFDVKSGLRDETLSLATHAHECQKMESFVCLLRLRDFGNAHTPTVIFFMTQPFEKDTNFINKRTQNIFVVIKSNCLKDSRITGVKSV